MTKKRTTKPATKLKGKMMPKKQQPDLVMTHAEAKQFLDRSLARTFQEGGDRIRARILAALADGRLDSFTIGALAILHPGFAASDECYLAYAQECDDEWPKIRSWSEIAHVLDCVECGDVEIAMAIRAEITRRGYDPLDPVATPRDNEIMEATIRREQAGACVETGCRMTIAIGNNKDGVTVVKVTTDDGVTQVFGGSPENLIGATTALVTDVIRGLSD